MERMFQAYKIVLAARSTVFDQIFSNTEDINKVEINDIREDIFEQLLEYIYTGELKKFNDLPEELIIAADKYQIKDLKDICQQKLISLISFENCDDLLKLSFNNLLNQLKEKIISLIKGIDESV